ncbi:hypothetical protein ACFQ5N_14150 [Lutibacter holmesii]|uniref:Lipoprotein n=1 Tax=Lutibacter holmesii TaxID=1137985 RepID=A0ABW3WTR4_9FLAO
MKTTYLFLIIILLFVSCSDSDSKQDKYYYTYTEDSELTIASIENSYMKYGNVENGENLVFEYRFDAYDEEQIADDEYTEIIRFEIDPELDKFSYSNEELQHINSVFTKSCFCFFPQDESKDVNATGTISGEKIDSNKWKISIDVTFYGDEKRTFEENFILN